MLPLNQSRQTRHLSKQVSCSDCRQLPIRFLVASVFKEIRVNDTTREVIHRLQDLGIDLDHVKFKKNNFIQFVVIDDMLDRLINDGINFEIVHENLEDFYASRLYDISSRDFDYGSMGGYYTYDEVIEHLFDLNNNYPDLVSDLQYLGCIRPHHKKADHVTRLIFGM